MSKKSQNSVQNHIEEERVVFDIFFQVDCSDEGSHSHVACNTGARFTLSANFIFSTFSTHKSVFSRFFDILRPKSVKIIKIKKIGKVNQQSCSDRSPEQVPRDDPSADPRSDGVPDQVLDVSSGWNPDFSTVQACVWLCQK